MRSPGVSKLLALVGSSLLVALTAFAQSPSADAPLVRLSFIQGDVRLSEGAGAQPDLSKNWEQAQVDIAIQQGFALTTGDGRAEIEIENGSWVYLAENSVLIFEELNTKGNATIVGLNLVSGIATLFVHHGPGDTFDVKTPVNSMSLADGAFLRLNSYLDSTLMTPQENLSNVTMNGVPDPQMEKGVTTALPSIVFVTSEAIANAAPPDGWDAWVSSRLQENQAATSAALKLSGLPAAIPGLEELTKTGSFFPCAPYGTCWDSNEDTLAAQVGAPQDADSQGKLTGATPQTTAAKPTVSTILINPCPRIWRTTWVGPDPKHPGKTKTEVTDFVERAGFLTCRAGSYIRFHKHYVWVVGKKKKRPPVRWVNAGGKVGFVLRHPNDAKGKPPLNLKYGVMIPPKKLGEPIQSIKIDPKKQVAVLDSPPKKFAADPIARLQKVSAPEIQGHLLTGGARRAAGTPAENARPGIPYDYKTGQFIRPGATIGKMTLKPTPFGGLTVGKPASSGSGGQRSNSGGTSARNGGGSSNSGGSRSYSGPPPSRGAEPVRSAPPPPEPRSAPAPAPEPSRRPP